MTGKRLKTMFAVMPKVTIKESRTGYSSSNCLANNF